MKLSIIITHHRTPELLYICLKSIQETTTGIDSKIIIADSEAEAKNKELIQDKFPRVKFLSFKKNLGYSKIVNVALKKTKGDYILIINADIVLLKDAISKMLKFLEKNHDVGIVAPQLLDFTNNIQPSCFTKPTLKTILARRTLLGKTDWGKKILNKFTIADWDFKSIKEVDWVQGSAIMIREKALEKVGLLDERFFMYFEDADWCRRFWQKGYKVVYLPSAKMAHYYHRASKKWGPFLDIFLNKYARTHLISAVKYFWKYKYVKN